MGGDESQGCFLTDGVKGKVYKIVVRPAARYDLETVTLTKRQDAELKMLRFSSGVARMEKIGAVWR